MATVFASLCYEGAHHFGGLDWARTGLVHSVIAERHSSWLAFSNGGTKATFIDGQALPDCSPIPAIRATRSIFSA